jgi:hypothetical protein
VPKHTIAIVLASCHHIENGSIVLNLGILRKNTILSVSGDVCSYPTDLHVKDKSVMCGLASQHFALMVYRAVKINLNC